MDWTVHLPLGAEPESVDLLRGGNLAAAFVEPWRARSDRPTLRDIDGRWLTGGELDERSASAALRLQRAGLGAGDRVMICAAPSAGWVIAYVAALRAGLVTVPVNPAYTRGETQRLVRAAGPVLALVDDDERGGWIAEAAGVTVAGLDLRALGPAGGGALAAGVPLDAAQPDDAALLMYTSGTTGTPKGALLSHANLLASARGVALAWRWTPEDRLLLALPLFHMHGLGVGINGSLIAGGTIALRPRFDPTDVAAHAREDATMFFGVPAMYARLGRDGDCLAALAGLRLLVSGSAPLPSALAEAVADATGQVPLERYGMTETVMLTSNPLDGPRKPGKVGLPLPGVELRLADADREVQVRGPNVMRRYDPRGGGSRFDSEAFTADGWFRTGDLGELDGDGHLRLIGRSKELIISGGFNVYPREVEEVLSRFPGVREVAVIGRPNQAWGEAVTAVIAAEGPLDPEAIRCFASEHLAAYKVPKAVEFVEMLPRNALGKVVRGEL